MFVKRYSNASTSITVKLANFREVLPMKEISGCVICEYDTQWWLALVLRTLNNKEEVEVRFLPNTSTSFIFQKQNDDLIFAQGHILMTVNPTIPTGRTCQLSTTEVAEATAKLNMKYI